MCPNKYEGEYQERKSGTCTFLTQCIPTIMKENIKKGPVGHVFFLNSVNQLPINMKENIKKGPVGQVFSKLVRPNK